MHRRLLSTAVVGIVLAGILPGIAVASTTGAAAAAPLLCLDTQPDPGRAQAMAHQCGRPVEVLARRTETDRVLAKPDGGYTLERAISPQRVRQPNGAWANVDPTLRAAPDGSIVTVATTGKVRFSGGGSGPLATMPVADGALRLSWPGALPTPRLEGDTAVYPDVFTGVDLRARALVTGFTYVLVVKNRAAAANPALRELRLPLAGDGVSVRNKPGGIEVVDRSGSVITSSAGASMWDSATSRPVPARSSLSTADRAAIATESAAEPRGRSGSPAVSNAREPGELAGRSTVAARMAGRDLVLTPDPALLTAASTVFPLYIDPSMSPTYWSYAQSSGADWMTWGEVWAGTNPGTGARYRGYFMFPVGDLVGRHIRAANFSVTMIHSWSCAASPVSLMRTTNPIDYRTPWRPDIYEWVDTQAGNAHKISNNHPECTNDPQPDTTLTFVSDLASEIAANAWMGWLTLGLIAGNQNESDEYTPYYWKRFDAGSARLVLDVNTFPAAPSAVQVNGGNPSCGSPSSPQYITDPTPAVTGYLSDADAENLTGKLEVSHNGAVQYTLDSAQSGNNFTAQWGDSQWSGHALQVGQVYSIRLYATDPYDTGPAFGPCYIGVDPDVPPGLAQAEPVGDVEVGQPATIRLKPAAGETVNVGSYDYGFDPVRLTMSVNTAADHTALIPLTVLDGDSPPSLYVRARSRAGRKGVEPVSPALDLFLGGTVPAAHRRDDANGDGRADVTGLQDLGNGTSLLYSITTKPGGAIFGPTLTSSPGAFSVSNTKSARGDFDGDGLADLAMLRQAVNDGVALTVAFRVGVDPVIVNPSVNLAGWNWSSLRLVSADFDGPSGGVARDDLVLVRDLGNATFDVYALLSSATMGAGIFANPVHWYDNPAGWADYNRMQVYAGDFDGDQKADLANFYDYDGCWTRLWLHYSSRAPAQPGDHLARGNLAWDGGPNNWCAYAGRKAVVGDVNGDGRSDISAFYDYGGCLTRVWRFVPPASGDAFLGGLYWASEPGAFCIADQEEVLANDVDADGRDDVSLITHCCSGYQYYLFYFRSQATSLAAPAVRWLGFLGPPGTPLT